MIYFFQEGKIQNVYCKWLVKTNDDCNHSPFVLRDVRSWTVQEYLPTDTGSGREEESHGWDEEQASNDLNWEPVAALSDGLAVSSSSLLVLIKIFTKILLLPFIDKAGLSKWFHHKNISWS